MSTEASPSPDESVPGRHHQRNPFLSAARHRGAGRAKHRRSTPRRTIGAITSSLLVVALAVVAPAIIGTTAASAAPGTPGTPQAATAVYTEDFENTGTTPVLLTSYTGAASATYTAAAGWLTNCNGDVLEFNSPNGAATNCAASQNYDFNRQLAYGLGVLAGSATPATNHAVAAFTEGVGPGANLTEFQTVNPIPLASSSGRYLTFSVDTAAVNCNVSAPLYNFSLTNGATTTPVGGQINACTSPTVVSAPAVGGQGPRADVRVGTYTSNGSVLFNGSSVGITMKNANGSGTGNDAAFDNIKILDVTPQLDKSFSPTSVPLGHSSALTFTITNTSELAAKNGWSFTDALPAGLTVTSPAASTTCPSGVVTAPAGGTSVGMTGNLNAGAASCTVTVNVTSTTAGDYTNGPTNVTQTGLNPPGSSTVTFTPNPWTCDAFGYLFQTPSSTVHQIYRVDLVTGAATQISTTANSVNAVGYNTLDNYFYGWDADTNTLVRINADGTLTNLGLPPGVNTGFTGFNIGDFDSAGHLWITTTGGAPAAKPWYELDLAPGSPTYGQVIASGTITAPASVAQFPSDWAYINGTFYGVAPSAGGTGAAHLVSFNAATHAVTDLGTVVGTTSPDPFGAAYADAAGNLYVSDNTTGSIYRINPITRATILLSNGPPSGGNDGARCATAPIPTISVSKTVAGRVQAADQFTVGLKNPGGTTVTSA
ncbi:MAG: hypothetical protein JWL99_6149, partial [Streptomyces oryziradicis]|nr:hypothetical protein [Actinacidiphila oryziradicis]